MKYESFRTVESKAYPGVWLILKRMSFSRRVDLMRRIRELAQRAEFLVAGEETREQMDGALARAEIDRTYVDWGLEGVTGMEVDGAPVTAAMLAEAGPENLFREAVDAIKAECGLTESERKN